MVAKATEPSFYHGSNLLLNLYLLLEYVAKKNFMKWSAMTDYVPPRADIELCPFLISIEEIEFCISSTIIVV